VGRRSAFGNRHAGIREHAEGVGAVDGFAIEESLSEFVERGTMRQEDVTGSRVYAKEQGSHLVVQLRLGGGAERRIGFVDEESGVVAHAEAVDHLPGDAVDVDEIVLGTAGHVVGTEDDFLGDATAEALDDLGFEVGAAVDVLVVIGREMGDAHCLAPRLDADLVQSVFG